MRIGCLQFAPIKGDVDNNLSRADAVLLKANPDDLDILVLPEMAFSGSLARDLQLGVLLDRLGHVGKLRQFSRLSSPSLFLRTKSLSTQVTTSRRSKKFIPTSNRPAPVLAASGLEQKLSNTTALSLLDTQRRWIWLQNGPRLPNTTTRS